MIVVEPTILALIIGSVVQLAFISYSYGVINQKVKDVDRRLERVENKLNGMNVDTHKQEGGD